MTSASDHDHDEGALVAARVERRWTIMSAAIVGLLIGMAIFAGIHKATMPQAWGCVLARGRAILPLRAG